jgi:drug/metabolite transporter (DMT)-like permease
MRRWIAGGRGSLFLVLLVSVVAMSWAAPLIRFSAAPPLAISFWRLAFSLPVIAAILTLRGEWAELLTLTRREWMTAATAGVFLALHFASWIASVTLTSVAASVALVATQPVWVALISIAVLRERPAREQWVGIFLAVLGAGIIGLGDRGGGSDPLLGDGLALAGALLVAVYYVIGRHLRQRIGIWPYVAVVYGFATVTLALASVAAGVNLAEPYATRDWLVFLALALGPMLIGHTGQNWALRFLPAHAVNLTLLGEPVGATLIAFLLPSIAETPTVGTLAGGMLILSGIVLGLRRR